MVTERTEIAGIIVQQPGSEIVEAAMRFHPILRELAVETPAIDPDLVLNKKSIVEAIVSYSQNGHPATDNIEINTIVGEVLQPVSDTESLEVANELDIPSTLNEEASPSKKSFKEILATAVVDTGAYLGKKSFDLWVHGCNKLATNGLAGTVATVASLACTMTNWNLLSIDGNPINNIRFLGGLTAFGLTTIYIPAKMWINSFKEINSEPSPPVQIELTDEQFARRQFLEKVAAGTVFSVFGWAFLKNSGGGSDSRVYAADLQQVAPGEIDQTSNSLRIQSELSPQNGEFVYTEEDRNRVMSHASEVNVFLRSTFDGLEIKGNNKNLYDMLRFDLGVKNPVGLVAAIMMQESRGQVEISSGSSYGLLQINLDWSDRIPGLPTAQEFQSYSYDLKRVLGIVFGLQMLMDKTVRYKASGLKQVIEAYHGVPRDGSTRYADLILAIYDSWFQDA